MMHSAPRSLSMFYAVVSTSCKLARHVQHFTNVCYTSIHITGVWCVRWSVSLHLVIKLSGKMRDAGLWVWQRVNCGLQVQGLTQVLITRYCCWHLTLTLALLTLTLLTLVTHPPPHTFSPALVSHILPIATPASPHARMLPKYCFFFQEGANSEVEQYRTTHFRDYKYTIVPARSLTTVSEATTKQQQSEITNADTFTTQEIPRLNIILSTNVWRYDIRKMVQKVTYTKLSKYTT